MELYLLRHADAGDPAEWDGDDAKRPLSAKGEKQARNLARLLSKNGFAPDSIVTSPKVRARQTAEVLAEAVGVNVDIDARLGALDGLDELDAVVTDAGGSKVVVVGHDPDFSDLCAELTGTPNLPIKKGAMCRIDVSLPLRPGRATLRWLVPPDLLG